MALNDGNGGGEGGDGTTGGGGAASALIGEEGASGAGGTGEGQGGDAGESGEGVKDPDWLTQLSGDGEGEEPSLRDWARSIGVKDLNGLAKIARDNQKALRDSGRVKVPGEGAGAEEIAAFRSAIGVPEKASDYKLPELKDADGNPLTDAEGNSPVNADKLGRIVEIAHKNGIPKAALEATLQEIAEADLNEIAGAENQLKADAAAHAKSWGAERAAKLDAIDQAGKHFKLDKDDLLKLRAAWGAKKALDFMAAVGAGIREDTLIDGGGRKTFQGDPVAAQKRLDEIKGDAALAEKARVKGSAINLEWNRLLEIVGQAEEEKAAAS